MTLSSSSNVTTLADYRQEQKEKHQNQQATLPAAAAPRTAEQNTSAAQAALAAGYEFVVVGVKGSNIGSNNTNIALPTKAVYTNINRASVQADNKNLSGQVVDMSEKAWYNDIDGGEVNSKNEWTAHDELPTTRIGQQMLSVILAGTDDTTNGEL